MDVATQDMGDPGFLISFDESFTRLGIHSEIPLHVFFRISYVVLILIDAVDEQWVVIEHHVKMRRWQLTDLC